jgi:two-component system sensor histidine kinase DesK
LGTRTFSVLGAGAPGQVPFTLALFVLPLLCAFPGTGRLVERYRWLALAAQAVLTWVPVAVFGSNWQLGIDGLLAGLVLLVVPGRKSWLLAGGLLAADVIVRATVTGLPYAPAWYSVVPVVTYYVDDALVLFGLVRLAQIVGTVEEARSEAAQLAAARERLDAGQSLQAAVGQRLATITSKVTAARRVLSQDAARARADIAVVGITARDAVAQARAMTNWDRPLPRREQAATVLKTSVIGERLAWAVLVATLSMYSVDSIASTVWLHYGARLLTLAVGDIAATSALQLYHSNAARHGRRPRTWPLTLALQAVLVYAFLFPFVAAYVGGLGPFLAGSALLMIPGWWRWAAYAAVVVTWSALITVLPLPGLGDLLPAGQQIPNFLLYATVAAGTGLMAYGLSRLAWLAHEMARLRGDLARMAVVQERVRVARDVHDLLGLGLSAIALKADLAGALIGRDDTRAAAEMQELGRICATARADVRLVTGDGARLALADEIATAKQLLASSGLSVRAGTPPWPVPPAADEVLAPVLREAVANILRHSCATVCTIELAAGQCTMQLRVSNDGVPQQPAGHSGRRGHGLANLDARVQAAGGRLTSNIADGRFELIAEIPLPGKQAGAWPAGRRSALPAWPGLPAGADEISR